MLLDTYDRVATDLRVSLTDKCNLRCEYCMPEQGLPWLPKQELLTDDEVIRLVRVAVCQLGVRDVRFTGGEPLLRPGLPAILAACAELEPRPELSLTTNGIGLVRTAEALREAGLDRINVSLDTVRQDTFRDLARRDRLDSVLDGIAAAEAAGMHPIKINAVLMPGVNEGQAPELLHWALQRGYELRFIEQMPLDAQHNWTREGMITAERILEQLAEHFQLEPEPSEQRGSAPAERWLVNGGPERVGVIASVTRPFCRACDRTRLTADGQVRNCLFATDETDLRGALRDGMDDDEVVARWRRAMWGKKAGGGIDDPSFLQPERPMSAIGG